MFKSSLTLFWHQLPSIFPAATSFIFLKQSRHQHTGCSCLIQLAQKIIKRWRNWYLSTSIPIQWKSAIKWTIYQTININLWLVFMEEGSLNSSMNELLFGKYSIKAYPWHMRPRNAVRHILKKYPIFWSSSFIVG